MVKNNLKSWAAGFIDGEGCFIIEKRADTRENRSICYRPRLKIQLRDDDIETLKLIQTVFGIKGCLYRRAARKQSIYGSISKPTVELIYTSISDLLLIINILKQHPLMSKKKKDFVVWEKAVNLIIDKTISKEQKNHNMEKLFNEIKHVRKYNNL